MTIDERDCANPYLRAADREYKLMSGGRSLCDDDAARDPTSAARSPFRSRSRFTRDFVNPFLKAAHSEHVLHTGHPLIAVDGATTLPARRSAGRWRRAYDPRVLHRARHRYLNRTFRLPAKVRKVLPWAALSTSLYALLFLNEQAVVEASTGHWWSFLVPVSIAFVFSLAHGNFTAAFWDAVGLKPNTLRK